MDLGLYDLALEGGGAQTKWQRQHARRVHQRNAKKHRAEAKAAKKEAQKAARADLAARRAKWLKGWKRKAAAAKAAGLPQPGKQGKPWRLGLEHSQVIDMTGWRFGRLTVIRSAPISLTMRTSQKCRVWVVKCSCGSPERIVNGTSLRQGNSTSCGCLVREVQRDLWKPGGAHARRIARLRAYKKKPLSFHMRRIGQKLRTRMKLSKFDRDVIIAARRIIQQWEIDKGLSKARKRYPRKADA